MVGDQDYVSWKDFVQGLEEAFLPPNHHARLRDQLARIKQKSSVSAYNTEFMNIRLQLAQLGDELTSYDAIDRYIRGLKPNVEREIRLWQDQLMSLTAIMRAADAYDVIAYSRHLSVSSYQTGNHNHHSSNSFSTSKDSPILIGLDALISENYSNQQYSKFEKLTESERLHLKKIRACFRCQK